MIGEVVPCACGCECGQVVLVDDGSGCRIPPVCIGCMYIVTRAELERLQADPATTENDVVRVTYWLAMIERQSAAAQ